MHAFAYTGTAGGLGSGGEVAGTRFTDAHPAGEAFLWTADAGLVGLGTLPGEAASRAAGVEGKASWSAIPARVPPSGRARDSLPR